MPLQLTQHADARLRTTVFCAFIPGVIFTGPEKHRNMRVWNYTTAGVDSCSRQGGGGGGPAVSRPGMCLCLYMHSSALNRLRYYIWLRYSR